MNRLRLALLSAPLLLTLWGCRADPPVALGTLERDRLTLPAPAFERIAEIPVREGQVVRAGDTVIVLESARSNARLDSALAEHARAEAVLAELLAGSRPESLAEARARWTGAQALARNAEQEFVRLQRIVERRLQPQSTLDAARAARDAAAAEVRAAREAVALLEHGSRTEQIEQARAGVAAAQAQVDSLRVDSERTRIAAPTDGLVESLPFEVGEQQPVGTPLAILLVGERAYARVYLPQAMRLHVRIGSAAQITLEGETRSHAGHVRSIRSEPTFTPYYALTGKDASRLSWLAEVELEASADALPVGMPLRATFDDAAPASTP